jgi:hypothetical protein
MKIIDQQMRDSNMAFYVNALESFDRTINNPLLAYTWSRDVKIRTDVTMGTESTSFMQNTFGAGASTSVNGMPFLNKLSTAIPTLSVDGRKVITPFDYLGMQIEIKDQQIAAARLNQVDLDTQMFDSLQEYYNQTVDEMVYVGSTDVDRTGLVNSALVASGLVAATGSGGATTFASKTPEQILNDFNEMLMAVYLATGSKYFPNRILIASNVIGELERMSGTSATTSIVNYLKLNNSAKQYQNVDLQIFPVKWLNGRGTGSTNRMMAYYDDYKYVRFPMLPIYRAATVQQAFGIATPYGWGFGGVEFVYPMTAIYRDGI